MKVYKATNKDLKCRGLQYEPGVEVKEEAAKLCSKGLHACLAPLDLFSYYAPGDGSRYFEAEAEDVSDERENDSKIVCKRLTIGAEIGIPGLVKAHIDYVKANTTTENTDPKMATAGDSGAATAGDSGAATAGEYGAATAGYRGAATAGKYGAATAGEYGAATSRGRSSSGKNGLSVARGNGVMVKGGLGAVLVIVEENNSNYDIASWASTVVDGETIKADTWYRLENGKFVETTKKEET